MTGSTGTRAQVEAAHWDAVVIGSGFGGAVSALRLAEKGHRVLVVEQGRELSPEDLAAAGEQPARLLRMPALGLKRGFFAQEIYRHVSLVRGIAVGGGSTVWAAVMLQPPQAFYDDPAWARLPPRDWRAELAPHYATAQRLLGVTPNPRQTLQDDWLRQTARRLGAEASWGPVNQAIYFGPAERDNADPFFDGAGPARRGCTFCARCATGCAQGAKNSLDKNYLFLARRAGARIRAERRVTRITPLAGGGYRLQLEHPWDQRVPVEQLSATRVVVAAGVVGTLELLLACRDRHHTLPGLSRVLGAHVRTNSESIVTVTARDPKVDISDGATISSHFYTGVSHVTQNRFSPAHRILRWQTGPLVDDAVPLRRALRTLWHWLRHPVDGTLGLRSGARWSQRTSLLTVMQTADNELAFDYRRGWLGWGLRSRLPEGHQRAPTCLPTAQRVAETFAQVSHGVPGNALVESLGNASITAHVLGGCVMGGSAADGVIDERHEVFGHPGLYVVDASAIPANVGVNPSLTITAMAERAMSLMPEAGADRAGPPA